MKIKISSLILVKTPKIRDFFIMKNKIRGALLRRKYRIFR